MMCNVNAHFRDFFFYPDNAGIKKISREERGNPQNIGERT